MSHKRKSTPSRRRGGAPKTFAGVLLAVLLVVLGLIVYQNATYDPGEDVIMTPSESATPGATHSDTPEVPNIVGEPVQTQEPSEPTEVPEVMPEFNPEYVPGTEPWNLVESDDIEVDGELVDSYTLPEPIDFGYGKDYTDVQGIVTFRGNNFREGASYGTARMAEKILGNYWTVPTGSMTSPNGSYWSGSGWTGQPLIMTWPKELRQKMNMYDWAKNADELTEVIYATMGGYVYFLELETGEYTRDALNLGYTFKGAGALDPRGYPILYLGSGQHNSEGHSRVFIISLIDCSTMYTFGNDDSFSLRGTLSYFDASPLVDAETDQLIYPGESGILYIIKLNTQFDPDAGTISIAPSRTVKWRYWGTRTTARDGYTGIEDSPVIWRGHIIMAENGGNLMCLDLQTLTLDWVQDVLDDTNCSPVLELEDGHPYVYISTSFHSGWRAPESGTATIPVWKIDAETGEIVWHTDYTCRTAEGVSGGVQGTIALGKNKLSDLIFVPVARTPYGESGLLVALRKDTGEEVWQKETNVFSWSSPVDVYDAEGNGYIIYCTSGGYMYLIDGLTGDILDLLNMGSGVESSPAVYNDMVVVGTRGQLIYGVHLY